MSANSPKLAPASVSKQAKIVEAGVQLKWHSENNKYAQGKLFIVSSSLNLEDMYKGVAVILVFLVKPQHQFRS